MKQFDPRPNEYFTMAATIPDVDGDGLRDLLIRGGYDVWAIGSSTAGGPIAQVPCLYSFSGLNFGSDLAVGGSRAVIASSSQSQLLFIDTRTGAVEARVSHNVSYGYQIGSLGQSAVSLGDITGDGIPDFASSGGNVRHNSGPTGSLFVFNGAIATSGSSFVPLPNLPNSEMLGELTGVEFMGTTSAFGGGLNTTANLGDPYPDNGDFEYLIVTGSPWGNYEYGGLVAHVLTRTADGSFNIQKVATYYDPSKEHYGQEIVPIGDVNADGVTDVAVFVGDYGRVGTGSPLGRIQIISGAGLLDGFQPATDVLQNIDGVRNAFFYGSVQGLGDYDNDVRMELAVSVLYNGFGGVYGNSQHIYEIVPEPASLLLLALGGLAMLRRRRT